MIKKNFTVENFTELEQIIDQALYEWFEREHSEKRSKYDQLSGEFKIYYYYIDENSEYEAYFTCEPVIETDDFRIVDKKLKK